MLYDTLSTVTVLTIIIHNSQEDDGEEWGVIYQMKSCIELTGSLD